MAALAAGASAGITDTASSAVRDAYAGLREAVRRRLAEYGRDAEGVLEASGVEPGVWQARLAEVLLEAGADRDEELLAAAQQLREQLSAASGRLSKYSVDAPDAKGVQIGDHNTQFNNFN
ncbi:hypothetical protein ACFQ93_36000 [Streptomyces sp. NPDC056601]|uniref:hypothetical protein n=1 Tax=Streptomyces sp. NPDC056601 TaxID=3345875 RepID=UPI0036B0AD1C